MSAIVLPRQKEEARRKQEAARRQQEAEGSRARKAAYHEALRREAGRISAILAKQVTCYPLSDHQTTFGKNHVPVPEGEECSSGRVSSIQ